MSVATLARSMNPNDFDTTKAMVHLLETEGTAARYRETMEAFARAMPIDVDVYLQLRDTPADRHPRICRGCACSDHDACVSADGAHRCSWSGSAICSRCDDAPAATVLQ